METRSIVYFDRPGRANTAEVVQAVRARIAELGISHLVVASNSGDTALAFHEGLAGLDVVLVAVTAHAGYNGGDAISMTDARRAELEACGVKVLTCAHALSGIERSISKKLGGVSRVEIVAHTLRLMGEGAKVAVEVALMAADAGLAPTDREIVAVGGSGGGADAALVLRAAHMNNFFDLEIREILAKPRQRK
jgi:hypothetical protein